MTSDEAMGIAEDWPEYAEPPSPIFVGRVLAAEVRRLRAEADTFQMDYRMKCDEQLKRAEVERDSARAEAAQLRRQNDNLLEQVEQLHAQTDRATEDEAKARAEAARLKEQLDKAPGIDLEGCEITVRPGEVLWANGNIFTLRGCVVMPKEMYARELDRLREAFARYARHDDDCGPWAGGCRCGYAASKAALEEKQ